jgi:hypothetical protein
MAGQNLEKYWSCLKTFKWIEISRKWIFLPVLHIELLKVGREYWMVYRGSGFLSVVWDFALRPPPSSPFPVSKLGRRHTGRLRKRDNLLTGEGENYTTLSKPGPLKIIQYSLEAGNGPLQTQQAPTVHVSPKRQIICELVGRGRRQNETTHVVNKLENMCKYAVFWGGGRPHF